MLVTVQVPEGCGEAGEGQSTTQAFFSVVFSSSSSIIAAGRCRWFCSQERICSSFLPALRQRQTVKAAMSRRGSSAGGMPGQKEEKICPDTGQGLLPAGTGALDRSLPHVDDRKLLQDSELKEGVPARRHLRLSLRVCLLCFAAAQLC